MSQWCFKTVGVFLIVLCLINIGSGMNDGNCDSQDSSSSSASTVKSSSTDQNVLVSQTDLGHSDHSSFHECHLGHCACFVVNQIEVIHRPNASETIYSKSDSFESLFATSQMRPPSFC